MGTYISNNIVENYLILFNNFIQDRELIIRKFYTNITMGISSDYTVLFPKVIKAQGSAKYYMILNMADANNLFCFEIDVLNGNKLTRATIIKINESNYLNYNVYMINDCITVFQSFLNDSNNILTIRKLCVDIKEDIDGKTYSYSVLKTYNYSPTLNIGHGQESDLTIKIPYLIQNGNLYNLAFDIVDLGGNTKTIIDDVNNYSLGDNLQVSFTKNYCFVISSNNILKAMYYDTNLLSIYEYSLISSYTNTFVYPVVLDEFNISSIFSLGDTTTTVGKSQILFIQNIFSKRYSSRPYFNNNFLIPQYINLYGNANDNTSVIFSRDVSNRFLAGNQLTATFNVPNYMLNNAPIQREDVLGQTNQTIESDIIQYSKNRFESLYLTYIYNMYITDNTNSNNELNTAGANRLANSVWNALDYQDSPLAKARVTYEDGLQDILNLNITNISGNTCTFEYEVSGDINKIEYLSNDEETVYATYRCNLTGTNTISQTITIEEG